ncbi:NAD(P)/FAD-dependent oxidoreductase [Methanofollis aquaemaris]|uniref:NAD(P)/FAD-dependent oxidoreductase n=1 Tax=Methanofollis aquaemaris TaxID=126734 RepID=A0A8A3S3K9_9EURY|nr:NAD(P)/FAD-dependent oxidoreductase [Methanofollis aquaemaris]QSZ66240.1 NAD(P)/FAD-dependent oxidoreductase [Methanofollis aquaemaris]
MATPTIIIIGGGPAGLFCAVHAAGEGRQVLVIEKKKSCGRKLLITGTGQCNLTHTGEVAGFFDHYGDHGKFLRPALRGFTNRNLVAFFEERGLSTVTEPNGKIFPASRKAADVLSLLLEECRRMGVEIRCDEAVEEVAATEKGFTVRTGPSSYHADALVVATGGATYPSTGSSGDGYAMARALGHTVTAIAPALAAVEVRAHPFADLAGISFEDLSISLFRENKKVREQTGDLLFTHSGLSGPGILHLSRYITAGDVLRISFLPGMTRESLVGDLVEKTASNGNRLVRTILNDYPLPERFIRKLLEAAGVAADLTSAHLDKKARNRIITHLIEWPLTVQALSGLDEAMVTRGGVSLDEVDQKSMASKLVPDLYFIGEVLDIDGDTGGYNLQAAFSTGFSAARAIARGEL